MTKESSTTFRKVINQYPHFKRKLLWLYDLANAYLPFIIGTLTRFPAYIQNKMNSKVLAKPGTLSYAGGVFNPGALVLDNRRIFLLARSQVVPWFKARGKYRQYYLQGAPVGFILECQSLKITEEFVITRTTEFPNDESYAIEDFRLFRWKGMSMVNHSLIIKGKTDGFIYQEAVQSALSCFDETEKSFRFCALPKVDFPTEKFEKNWMYREHGEELLLFYSVNPYKVLALEVEGQFVFKTIINRQFGGKLKDPGGFGTMVSYSTNPIDFDDAHWLMVIHQIKYTSVGRCYYHWAVLIDNTTFFPVKITSTPIFSGKGARGRLPGYRYISSILNVENEILFFAGEGDVYVTVTKKPVTELSDLFVDI